MRNRNADRGDIMGLLDKLTLGDLDKGQRELAECIGLDAYKKLLKNYAGSPITVLMPGIKNIDMQTCSCHQYKNIDEKNVLSEFSAFINSLIDNNDIVGVKSGIVSDIGWIDYKKNKIYLHNAVENNFYTKFTKYLAERGKQTKLSKQAFVRCILEANGIIIARYAGRTQKIKRYDYERTIGKKIYRVLVLDLSILNEYRK
ncbi:MAG: hypothetical protein K2J73_04245 [Oscillospiraceae bacterium]|nr:hypothetical protein [Oscillospiraceae bacterium]